MRDSFSPSWRNKTREQDEEILQSSTPLKANLQKCLLRKDKITRDLFMLNSSAFFFCFCEAEGIFSWARNRGLKSTEFILLFWRKVSQRRRKKDEVKWPSPKATSTVDLHAWLRGILGTFLGMFADGREDVRAKKEAENGMKGREQENLTRSLRHYRKCEEPWVG